MRQLLCMNCGVEKPMNHADEQMGFKQRRVVMHVERPKEHFMLINGERTYIPALMCDLCGNNIKDGHKAVAMTVWRGAEPGPWEIEYVASTACMVASRLEGA